MSAKRFDPRHDKDYPDYFKGEQLALAARVDAHRAEAERLWSPPPRPLTLYEQLEEGVPEVDWIIRELLPAGIGQINAQWKVGKTTLVLNAIRSLLVGEPFLARFEVNSTPDMRIGYLNMELPKRQALSWLSDMALPADASKRLEIYHAREYGFGVLDFSNDLAVEWIVSWLCDNGINVLAADPLGALYNPARWGNADPNAAFLQWWAVLEEIVRRAQLRGVLIAHHTGFSEDAAGRARGASAMMDKPDVNISYRHGGAPGGDPVDTKRYLTAYGRDVNPGEFEIDYDSATRLLYATGGGSRVDAVAEREALRCCEEILHFARQRVRPNKTELFQKLGWPLKGDKKTITDQWYSLAKRQGWLTAQKVGTAWLHEPGENATAAAKVRVAVSKRPSKGSKRAEPTPKKRP